MAVESIGTIYSVNIPGLTDSADIQNAFKAYHYGAYTSIATTAGIGAGGIAYWLKEIETDIALLEARPSSGGDATSSAPVAGDFTPSGIPDGYIWVDLDGSMTSSVIGATAVYNNNAPTSSLTSGLIWVDKDATTSTTGNPFIPQAIIAAKGDLLAGISNDTVTVLTVGSNGQYLKADSSTTSGLAWGDPGDLTAVSAGTGITVTNGTGPIPSVAVDTTLVATTSNTMTLSNKTLVAPTIQGASVTGGTFIGGTFTSTPIITVPTINNPAVTGGTFIGAAITSSTTFAGTSTTETMVYPILISPEERLNVSASTSTGTINIDLATAATWYYTNNSAANHTLNFRHSSSTSLTSALTTNDSITAVWMNTNGTTAYYPNVITVDGATSGVSVKWQGGTAPTAGNASSIDAYVFNIIKTAATSYTVLASQTKFA
jgi:hypothetical protein